MTTGDELTCGRCGYSLHLLPPSARCPECGVLVARSALGDHLAASDARWRVSLAGGLGLISLGIWIWMGLQVAVGQGYKPARASPYIVLLSILLSAVGMWLVTEPEPDPLKPESSWSRRRILRTGWITVWLMYLASPLFGIRQTIFSPEFSGQKFYVIVNLILAMAMFFLFGLFVGNLIRRAGRKQLGWLWRFVGGAGLVAGLAFSTPVVVRFLSKYEAATTELATVLILASGFAVITTLAGLVAYSACAIWQMERKV